jgi:hypothetical protein
MKGKIIALGQMGISIGIMFIYGGFYPNLSFPTQLEADQIFFIRFLASFCFHGDWNLFWALMVLISLLTLFISTILLIKEKDYLFSYFKSLAISQILIIFLFYTIADPPRFKETAVRFILPTNFLVMNGLILFLIIFLNLIFWLIRRSQQQPQSDPAPITVSIYQCPHCEQKFFSNIKYCPDCKKEIEPILLQ